jgi:hypothetical protein
MIQLLFLICSYFILVNTLSIDRSSTGIPCHMELCDKRTHYCDNVVKRCTLCADECSPLRIDNDPAAIYECNIKCPGWYEKLLKPIKTDCKKCNEIKNKCKEMRLKKKNKIDVVNP